MHKRTHRVLNILTFVIPDNLCPAPPLFLNTFLRKLFLCTLNFGKIITIFSSKRKENDVVWDLNMPFRLLLYLYP